MNFLGFSFFTNTKHFTQTFKLRPLLFTQSYTHIIVLSKHYFIPALEVIFNELIYNLVLKHKCPAG